MMLSTAVNARLKCGSIVLAALSQTPMQHMPRRAVLGAAGAAVLSLAPDSAAARSTARLPFGYRPPPPGVIVLQLSEASDAMQGIMTQAADDLDKLTLQRRVEAGRPPLSRGELDASIDVMLANITKESMRVIVDEPADTLRGVKTIAAIGKGDISREECLLMAKQYSRARDELRKAFGGLPEDEQILATAFNIGLQTASGYAEEFYARARVLDKEAAKVRLARARIAQENARLPSTGTPPKRKKTLAELEAANGNVELDQPRSVVSLYAQ